MSDRNRKAGTGQVKISESVVASVAVVAASEVEGVKTVGGKKPASISQKAPRIVSLAFNETSVTIDISISVKYGSSIPAIGKEVQAGVAAAVEAMTGLSVAAVNVHCVGIAFPKEKNEKK